MTYRLQHTRCQDYRLSKFYSDINKLNDDNSYTMNIETHGNVSLFCKTHNFETVNYMFSDEPNITVLPFENDPQVIQFINQNRLQPNLIKIGHENFSECIPNINFDKCFYRQFNIDFDNIIIERTARSSIIF